MKCYNCGAELVDGVAFCCFCGSEQSVSHPQKEPIAIDVVAEDLTGSHCIEPDLPAESKRKKPIGLIVAACIAAALTVVVILGFCTNWFGFYGPATRIALAAKNTGKAGNFTVVMNTKMEGVASDSISNTENQTIIQVDIDPNNRKLLLYGKSEQKYLGQTLTIYIGIIDGNLITGTVLGRFQNYQKEDISEELEEFFDTYDDPKQIDWAELFDIIKENTKIDPNEYIDVDIFEECILAYFRKLNSNSWLKENAGYSTFRENGMRYYNFDMDLYDFSQTTLACFEEAFESGEDYKEIMQRLSNAQTMHPGFDVELHFGVQRNRLEEINMRLGSDNLLIDCTLEFEGFGNTEIPMFILEDLLMKAG